MVGRVLLNNFVQRKIIDMNEQEKALNEVWNIIRLLEDKEWELKQTSGGGSQDDILGEWNKEWKCLK